MSSLQDETDVKHTPGPWRVDDRRLTHPSGLRGGGQGLFPKGEGMMRLYRALRDLCWRTFFGCVPCPACDRIYHPSWGHICPNCSGAD